MTIADIVVLKYQELQKEIERLEEICDDIETKFDETWDFQNDSFEDYYLKKQKAQGNDLVVLKKARKRERMLRPVEYSELPDYGDVMSLEDFRENVSDGGFMNSDGYGYYIKEDKETNIEIYPSDFKDNSIRTEFTEIIWFNK